MIVLKVLAIIAIVLVALFLLTLVIYFFNLDMKFAAVLIKPLTAYYNWSKNRREVKKKKRTGYTERITGSGRNIQWIYMMER